MKFDDFEQQIDYIRQRQQMLKTITDFAKERNVDRDTVNAYMNNHTEIKDFTKLVGKNRVIDTESEAYQLLEKKYPLPQPIIIQEDVETIKELSQTRRELADEKQKIVSCKNSYHKHVR